MRRPLRVSLAAACAGGFSLGALAASCTTFNGLSVPPPAQADAAIDASAEATTLDGPTEASEAAAPAKGLLSPQDAARVCALAAKCPYLSPSIQASIAMPADPTNFSLCMHWLEGPYPPDRLGFGLQQQALMCIAMATTCEGAGSCVSVEYLNPTDPRCADAGSDAGTRCVDNGATVLSCGSLYANHCNSAYYATGSMCTQGIGDYGCSLGTNCTVIATCIGSSVFDECGISDGLHYQLNCAYDGYDCAETQDGGIVGCLTGNQSLGCSTLDTNCTSDGKAVQVCDGYDYSWFDCTALSGTCSDKTGTAICTTPADKCTPFDNNVNTCSGNTVSLCVGGKAETFDCNTIGLTCTGAAGSGHCG